MNPIEDDTDSWWDEAVDFARCIPRLEVQLGTCPEFRVNRTHLDWHPMAALAEQLPCYVIARF